MESSQKLLKIWRKFYQEYNQPELPVNVNIFHSKHLASLNATLPATNSNPKQRADEIDNTIALSDTINAIGFITSIFLTTIWVSSIKARIAPKTPSNRYLTNCSGNLDYRINLPHDKGELGDLGQL